MKSKHPHAALFTGTALGVGMGLVVYSGALMSGEWRALVMLLPHAALTGLIAALWMTGLIHHGQD